MYIHFIHKIYITDCNSYNFFYKILDWNKTVFTYIYIYGNENMLLTDRLLLWNVWSCILWNDVTRVLNCQYSNVACLSHSFGAVVPIFYFCIIHAITFHLSNLIIFVTFNEIWHSLHGDIDMGINCGRLLPINQNSLYMDINIWIHL